MSKLALRKFVKDVARRHNIRLKNAGHVIELPSGKKRMINEADHIVDLLPRNSPITPKICEVYIEQYFKKPLSALATH